MKLHTDGTLEGTPQEIAEYDRLTRPQMPGKSLSEAISSLIPKLDVSITGSGNVKAKLWEKKPTAK